MSNNSSNKIAEILSRKKRYSFASAVSGTEAFIISTIVDNGTGEIMYVALDDARMSAAQESLAFFAPDIEVITIPAWDCIPYDRISPNSNITGRRIRALSKLAGGSNGKKLVIITTVNALIQKVIPRGMLANASFTANIGNEIDRNMLSDFLISNGYINTGNANEPGEFALRGSIVDIVPTGSEYGYRLDFFGDRLESIRVYDPLTQVSGGRINQINLVPASEVLLDEKSVKLFRNNYRQLFGAVQTDDPLYNAVSENRKYAGMEHWLPLFYEKMESIFDFISNNAVIIFDHLVNEAHQERENLIKDSYETRKKAENIKTAIAASIYHPLPPEMLYLTVSDWENKLSGKTVIDLHPFSMPESADVTDLCYTKARDFFIESSKSHKNSFDLVKAEIDEIADKNILPLISCMSEGSRSRMELMLSEHGIEFIKIDKWEERKRLRRNHGKPGLIVLGVESGFRTQEILLITEQDILGEKIFRYRTGKKKKTENFLAEVSNLNEGEIVVHRQHGIGRFEGLETLTVSDQAHDCLKLIYAGGDRLYVPVENIEMVTRYGSSDEAVQLDKLGGLSWQQRTSALKKRIKVAAEELLQVAAERALRKSLSFSPASSNYEEFCARFPYSETDDQQRAIDDVTADLQSGKPMDRLVCGDVGFGKTEVALRAAYIVACPHEGEEKAQVALITPTTLLCRQHFQTFQKRFAGTTVVIRQLSRMVPAKEAAETRKMIADGSVDIIVGTHALLAKNIEFKKLGLLIVDEEQHFGVAQKERLKKFKSNIHVLTLTATPIPRTLQLSLTSIRELSIIATPPIDRLAVRTYVMPFDQVVIREAILREHYRGGRTFYVCPRIADLADVEKMLKELAPETKIITAHGQMPPEKLDEIMTAFYEGVYDILLSTTIVESGLDIPQANTIIIHRADMFGLAQLYQLRGRVGRSKIRAYAYLTLPNKHIPTKQALKRLEVMQKLDTLGAGFTLASHDMDIRGFGNLLGEEQSGNIREVGVELYQDMLREAIEQLKLTDSEAKGKEAEFSPQINIGTSVLIPDSYVADLSLRMGLYRRIAALETEQDIDSMAIELVDRFGSLPKEVENLLAVVRLKQICRKAGIEKLDVGPKGAVISFYQNNFARPDKLIGYITENNDIYKLRGDQKLIISNQAWEKTDTRINNARQHIQEIAELAA